MLVVQGSINQALQTVSSGQKTKQIIGQNCIDNNIRYSNDIRARRAFRPSAKSPNKVGLRGQPSLTPYRECIRRLALRPLPMAHPDCAEAQSYNACKHCPMDERS